MRTRKKIEEKANEILKMLNINEIPTPLEDIAESYEIIIQEEEFNGDLSGMLLRDIDKTIIGINKLDSNNRKRFTIAHELGHYVLHKGNPIHIDRTFRVNFRDKNSSLANNYDEIEANAFAAALLMPEKKIKQIVNKKLKEGIDIEDSIELQNIADMFEVSKQALLIRLFKLGLIEDLGI